MTFELTRMHLARRHIDRGRWLAVPCPHPAGDGQFDRACQPPLPCVQKGRAPPGNLERLALCPGWPSSYAILTPIDRVAGREGIWSSDLGATELARIQHLICAREPLRHPLVEVPRS